MTCNERIAEIVECARRRSGPAPQLRAHLSGCEQCAERWEREQQLTAQLRVIGARTADLRSPENRREALMRDFSRRHARRAVPAWAWGLAAAAVLLLAFWPGRGNRPVPASGALYEVSADASALSSDDFIAVPYTPPLAPGEMVRVVHADLYPEALASLGLGVDPAWADDHIPVDMVLGGDGLPRAVRITD